MWQHCCWLWTQENPCSAWRCAGYTMRCAKYVKFILKPQCVDTFWVWIYRYNKVVFVKHRIGERKSLSSEDGLCKTLFVGEGKGGHNERRLKLELRSIVMTWLSNCVQGEIRNEIPFERFAWNMEFVTDNLAWNWWLYTGIFLNQKIIYADLHTSWNSYFFHSYFHLPIMK